MIDNEEMNMDSGNGSKWRFYIFRQIVVCTSLLREISGGNKVEADCDAINNASSFGVNNIQLLLFSNANINDTGVHFENDL